MTSTTATATVFRVYALKEDGFTVIVDGAGRTSRLFDVDEFAAYEVLKAAGVDAELKPTMTLTTYKKMQRRTA